MQMIDHFDKDSTEDLVTNSRIQSDNARKELENYLSYISNKKDSDGNPLVTLPSNFDLIADSMNRDDLNSTSAS